MINNLNLNIMQLQPILSNDIVRLQPLQSADFEALFAVAADPLIWEQHPNKNRYQRAAFENYFEGAMLSKGAFLVMDVAHGNIIGSTRFYDFDAEQSAVLIGYTFIARAYWGKQINRAMKQLMLAHAYQYVDTVLFHIGAENIRSQIAMQRIGGVKKREIVVAYHGEPDKLNFEYAIQKADWFGLDRV